MPSGVNRKVERSTAAYFDHDERLCGIDPKNGLAARNSALMLGADDFLLKPLEREEVLLRVRNLLHTRRLYTELASAKEALERHEGKPGKVP